MTAVTFMRRKEAGAYLKENFGFGSPATLAKLATLGGGPPMVYAGKIPLYTQEALTEWALSKLAKPVRSTSERQTRAA
jgi:hypothetical protein